MNAEIYDDTRCSLGEGPLWHPGREQLFWFDINEKRLYWRDGPVLRRHQFDEHVSAAGWLDDGALLVASETALMRFSIADGTSETVAPLEADNPVTRSNDGRADPWGGFWIGTMGKEAEPGAGAIYRFLRGEIRVIVPSLTVSNSICFAPDGSAAFWADTRSRRIMRQALSDKDGWPSGEPEVFVDLSKDGLNPDGSVIDDGGNLWNAQWGAGQVSVYDPIGRTLEVIAIPAVQTTCPAFGGPDLSDLYVTSAGHGQEGASDGKTFVLRGIGKGQAEHRVIL